VHAIWAYREVTPSKVKPLSEPNFIPDEGSQPSGSVQRVSECQSVVFCWGRHLLKAGGSQNLSLHLFTQLALEPRAFRAFCGEPSAGP
jgi:hypothetical protein